MIPKEELTEEDKKKIKSLILEAELLKNEGKFEDSERKLIEGLALDQENIEINRQLSDLYFTLGNHKKALSLLKKVTEMDPEDHKSIWQIGEIYFLTGDNETAELLVEKALDLKNDNPKYYFRASHLLMNILSYQYQTSFEESVQIQSLRKRPICLSTGNLLLPWLSNLYNNWFVRLLYFDSCRTRLMHLLSSTCYPKRRNRSTRSR